MTTVFEEYKDLLQRPQYFWQLSMAHCLYGSTHAVLTSYWSQFDSLSTQNDDGIGDWVTYGGTVVAAIHVEVFFCDRPISKPYYCKSRNFRISKILLYILNYMYSD